MNILYKVTYLPHLNTNWPKYYVGSKYNYKGNYFGSVDSKQIYEYTEGLTLKDWWKKEKKIARSTRAGCEHRAPPFARAAGGGGGGSGPGGPSHSPRRMAPWCSTR